MSNTAAESVGARQKHIDAIVAEYPHTSRADLATKSDAYLEARANIIRGGVPARTDTRVSRTDANDHGDRHDPELAALIRRFDAASSMLENYASADPFLHGEEAAWHAAEAATFGRPHSFGRADARGPSVAYAGVDADTAAAMERFDRVVGAGERQDFVPYENRMTTAAHGGGYDPAIVGQSAHAASLSVEEYAALSAEQRAAVDEILNDAAKRLAAIRGAT